MPSLLFCKKAIIEPSTVGLQWVGWKWMVIAGETAPSHLKNIAVAGAITANELMGSQMFGRLMDCIKETSDGSGNQQNNNNANRASQLNGVILQQPFNDPADIKYTSNQKYLKVGLASTLAGNIFYVVDSAVLAACIEANLSTAAMLALRSVSVGISDMIAFQIGSETSDTIKLQKCSKFQMFKKNLSGAIEAGFLAASYTLGNYIGEVISNACNVEDDKTRASISSLCIFSSTAIASSLKYLITSKCDKQNRVLPAMGQ